MERDAFTEGRFRPPPDFDSREDFLGVSSPIVTTPPTADATRAEHLPLALAAARTAWDNRARDIVVLDMRRESCYFDYFVIATGTSRRQLHAISEEIDRVLEKTHGEKRMGIEGYVASNWILLDYGTVVIHLFDEPTREFYDLESLWAGAPRVDLGDTIPAGDR